MSSLNNIRERSLKGKDVIEKAENAAKAEKAAKVLLKNVHKNVRVVKSNSMAMVAYYDICAQEFKVFESFKG